ncbi:MAG: glycosyltransferase family 2 protein [Phycisphaerales bacterium JB040]
MSPPLVSVVIPMYNAATTVERSLNSLRAQRLQDWEAVVVDDGSTDDGAAIARAMRASDPRIRLVSQPNRGVSVARNVATDEACGVYLAWLDPDDLMRPEGLAALVEGAESGGTGAAVGHHDVVSEAGRVLHPYRILPERLALRELLEGWSTRCGSHVVRRDLVGDVRWDESLSLWEDRDCWLRLAERGVCWTRVDRVVTDYVIRADSLSKRALDMMTSGERVLRSLFARHDGEPGFGPDRLDDLVASNALACASRASAISRDGERPARALAHAIGARAWGIERLADAGWYGVLYGCARCPERADPSSDWWRGLDGLWEALGLSDSRRSEAWRAFERVCVTPHRVACALLDRCEGAPGLVVVGCGRNGRAVLEECARRGVPTQARDDLATPGWAESAPMGDPVPEGWRVVITPYEDTRLRARFPGALRASEVRDSILSGTGVRLEPVRG